MLLTMVMKIGRPFTVVPERGMKMENEKDLTQQSSEDLRKQKEAIEKELQKRGDNPNTRTTQLVYNEGTQLKP